MVNVTNPKNVAENERCGEAARVEAGGSYGIEELLDG